MSSSEPRPQGRPSVDEVDELVAPRWHEDDGLFRELLEWRPSPKGSEEGREDARVVLAGENG